MRAIFITGTDTGVGKSVIVGLLARYLKDKGYNVITQKWIQTGSFYPLDIYTHLKILKEDPKVYKKYLKYTCPYIFRFPASAHLAARLEKKKISKNKIIKSFKYLLNNFDFVIVEGTGGLLVPYNQKNLIFDIAKELDLAVVVVVGNKLGAINHTLLTINFLRKEGMKIVGLIFNNLFLNQKKIILTDNVEIIKKFTNEKVLGVLPYKKNMNLLFDYFSIIGENLFKRLKWTVG